MTDLPALTPGTVAALHHLQCLDDAIAYRAARLSRPCPDCTPAARCADHASDEQLITAYEDCHAGALRQFLDRFDAADVTRVMTGSDGTSPTVLAGALALHARLRELAAEGPFITTLDAGPVIISLDGGRLTEHPLAPGSDDPASGR